MTQGVEMLPVEQSDRDMAHEIMQIIRGYAVKLPHDGHWLIQMLAEHRSSNSHPAATGSVRELPEVAPGHWTTPAGRDMALATLDDPHMARSRERISDFALANEVFLSPGIANLTDAKERIRWLSAQLLLAAAPTPDAAASEAGEVAYACVSDAACVCYPGINQAAERAAFCAGAAYNADGSLPTTQGGAEALPVEPTDAMWDAFDRYNGDKRMGYDTWRAAWSAMLAASPTTAASGFAETWLPITDDAKSGELVELVVNYTDGGHPLADGVLACTIGFNALADTGEDEWKFAGWCWSHDHFVQGKGKPIAWRPSRLNATDDGLPPLPALTTQGGAEG